MLSVAMSILPTQLQAAPVVLESTFTGGLYGAFNLQYDSTATDVQLLSVKFDLSPTLYVDPTFVPPGALLPLPFIPYSGAAETGYLGATGINDGAYSFTLFFDDFDPGETFNFGLDVDGPCGGFLCTPGAITVGSEFAGTTLTGTFGEPAIRPRISQPLLRAQVR